MKRFVPLLCVLQFAASIAFANDQLKNVQSELKNQGFFYGEVDGKPSAELNAAVRRYQIRNGLEVSGDLSDETLSALGLGSAPERKSPPSTSKPPAPAPPATPPPAATAQRPPFNLRKGETVEENDHRFLEREEPGRPPTGPGRNMVPPPAPLEEPTEASPSGAYIEFFKGTPYATAPKVVQEQTVRRAQTILASRGLYRDPIDGDAGPATEEAVLSFQRRSRLPLTGRLDLQTLASLRLLPGRGPGNPPIKPFNEAPDRGTRQQVYRGVWVE